MSVVHTRLRMMMMKVSTIIGRLNKWHAWHLTLVSRLNQMYFIYAVVVPVPVRICKRRYQIRIDICLLSVLLKYK